MKIESPNENKIIVELTDGDMEELDITYEEMDYSNIETRRVIWTILDRVRKFLGKDIDPSGKMLIETLPKDTGGCFIFFTVCNNITKGLVLSNKKEDCLVYEFENLDNVIDLMSRLKNKCGLNVNAELYSNNRKFRIIVNSADNIITRNMREYGQFCGKDDLLVQSTKEHWNLSSSNIFGN